MRNGLPLGDAQRIEDDHVGRRAAIVGRHRPIKETNDIVIFSGVRPATSAWMSPRQRNAGTARHQVRARRDTMGPTTLAISSASRWGIPAAFSARY